MYIYINMYIYTYIYIKKLVHKHTFPCKNERFVQVYMYIYIYINTLVTRISKNLKIFNI